MGKGEKEKEFNVAKDVDVYVLCVLYILKNGILSYQSYIHKSSVLGK